MLVVVVVVVAVVVAVVVYSGRQNKNTQVRIEDNIYSVNYKNKIYTKRGNN